VVMGWSGALPFLAGRDFFALGDAAFCFKEDSRVSRVGPSLEYGGVAVAIVVSAGCSVEDANMSLMRLAFAMAGNASERQLDVFWRYPGPIVKSVLRFDS
jgi:hypothetical protein